MARKHRHLLEAVADLENLHHAFRLASRGKRLDRAAAARFFDLEGERDARAARQAARRDLPVRAVPGLHYPGPQGADDQGRAVYRALALELFLDYHCSL